MGTSAPNSIFGNSLLGSKWFNPEYLLNQAILYFHQLVDAFNNTGIQFTTVYHVVSLFLFFLVTFFFIIIFYTFIRLFEIRKKEKEHLKHELEEYAHHHAEKEKKMREADVISKNPHWIKTLDHLFSQHESDWKLSVIEADAMLNDLMDQLGFKGETLGDKLKAASQSNFRNLSAAWEVHTIRNRIAHEGMNFELQQREAKRVIALYEQIFREFGYI